MSQNPNAPSSAEDAGTPSQVGNDHLGLFKAAFNNSPAMQSVVRAADGLLVEVNDTFLKKLGFERRQVIGKTPPSLNFWIEPEQFAAYRKELQSQGFISGREVRLRTQAGQELTVLLSTHPVRINGVDHFLTAGVDITARKQAEAELRASNERLRQSEERFGKVFRTSPALVVITRIDDGTFVAANEAFLRITGFTEAELIGRTSADVNLHIAPLRREEFLDLLRRQGSVHDREFIVRAKDGRPRTLLVSADLIEIDGATHAQIVGLDITERRHAEQALRESEAKFRSLYDLISTAVIVHDDKGILQVNPAALRLFGADRVEDVLGKMPNDAAPPTQPNGESSDELGRRHIARALAEGTHQFEWMVRKLDGATDVPVEVTLTSLELEGRQVLQAVVTDLTERKRAEAELQNALAKERELSQLKSDFVSLVSHEFRTPLEIIISSADNLDRYHDRLPAEKRQQLLRTINRSVRRMALMMEEVLVLGRLETDRMTFHPVSFNWPAFCQKVCDEIEAATAKRSPIRLRIDPEPREAFGDESVLRHIFTNLLSNAVKYSKPGESVDWIVERAGEQAVCRVVDRGCGIPAGDQKRLFQAFHRASNVRQIPGTGLGLLIVKRCVDLHGGEIEFESSEGKGTMFEVSLPLFRPST